MLTHKHKHTHTHTQDFYLFDKLNAFVRHPNISFLMNFILVRTSG